MIDMVIAAMIFNLRAMIREAPLATWTPSPRPVPLVINGDGVVMG